MMTKVRNVAILVFQEAELLDFCGPFETFSVANEVSSGNVFNVYAVSENGEDIHSVNGLTVKPGYRMENCPPPDILLIPGGIGTRKLLQNETIISWIQKQATQVELLLSVCTGALVLAKTQLLDGLSATTHHTAFDLLAQLAPNTTIVKNQKYVDNGKIILSAGISAGIEMSLYAIAKLCGKELALRIAAEMEYDWSM